MLGLTYKLSRKGYHMPDYGYDSVMDIWGRVFASVWIIYFLICVRRGWFDLRFRGFDTLLTYTEWRVAMLLGGIVVFQAIPLLILGERFSEMFQARDTFLSMGLFLVNIIGIPLAIIIATVAQIRENRQKRKSKPKNDYLAS